MNASEQAARTAIDERKARRRLRWRIPDTVAESTAAGASPPLGVIPASAPVTPAAPPDIVIDEVLTDPEDVVAALNGCIERAERFAGRGRSVEAFACLDEAADLFASLDDYESAALAGNARRAARFDEVIESLLDAVEDYRR